MWFGVPLWLSGRLFSNSAGLALAQFFLFWGCVAMVIGAVLVYGAFESRRRDDD